MPIGLIVALILAVGGGASVAAQASVPGDVLYGVKVNINEQVRAAFALSAAAKARVAADRAAERLEEVERLSAKADISAQSRADLEANFQAFADRADARIQALVDTDARAAADVASQFEVALEAHEKVLANLAALGAESRAEVGALAAKAAAEARQAAQLRANAEAKVRALGNEAGMKVAAEGKLQAAKNVVVATRRFINEKKDQLTASEIARAEAQVNLAENLIVQGEAKITAGAYAEAFNLGNTAIRTAQSVHLLIGIQEDIEVRVERQMIQERADDQEKEPEAGMPEQSPTRAEAEVKVDLRLNF